MAQALIDPPRQSAGSSGSSDVLSAEELQKMYELDSYRNSDRIQRGRGGKKEASQEQRSAPQRNLPYRAALAQKRRAARQQARYLAAVSAKEASKKKGKDEDKDYPNPLGIMSFAAFGVIASLQDLVPAVLDLVFGVGWVLGYILLPFTWFCYWYIIVRRAPKSLQRKFLARTALISAVGLIPYLGEILPEWMATALGSYMYVKRYEAGGVGLEELSSTTKNLAQGKSQK